MPDRRRWPAIPPPSTAVPSLVACVNAVRETLRVMIGEAGDKRDQVVTVADLIRLGVIDNVDEF